MRVLPIVMAAAIGTFFTAAAFAQGGAGSNQPAGQATTTQSSEGQMDTGKSMGKKMSKKHAKHAKKAKKEKM